MLIVGVHAPDGTTNYLSVAFPSACGKTNLAMLIPPKAYQDAGWKTSIVGDDIAWLWPHEDGKLHAINPETGYFGVAPGTAYDTNPLAMESIKENAIFTNVGLTDDGDVWWEGMSKNPARPSHRLDRPGLDARLRPHRRPRQRPLHRARRAVPDHRLQLAEPGWRADRRASSSAAAARRPCRSFSKRCDWNHGVYVGATMGSEMTAAAAGTLGKVRRDPMAMLPFCGYNMGDYFGHWLEMRQLRHQAAALLPRQLVPQERRGQIPVARLRRKHARPRVDRQTLQRPGRRPRNPDRLAARPSRTSTPRVSTASPRSPSSRSWPSTAPSGRPKSPARRSSSPRPRRPLAQGTRPPTRVARRTHGLTGPVC